MLNRGTQCLKGLPQVNNIISTEILHSPSDLDGHMTYLMHYFSCDIELHRYGIKGGYARDIFFL